MRCVPTVLGGGRLGSPKGSSIGSPRNSYADQVRTDTALICGLAPASERSSSACSG